MEYPNGIPASIIFSRNGTSEWYIGRNHFLPMVYLNGTSRFIIIIFNAIQALAQGTEAEAKQLPGPAGFSSPSPLVLEE